MKSLKTSFAGAALLLSLGLQSAPAQGTAFIYQGRLSDNNTAANGLYDLRFRLFDAVVNGNTIAGPLTNSAVFVAGGLFTTTLDFGNAFDGSPRWVEFSLRPNTGSVFATLSPRQPVLAVPYALTSGDVTSPGIARLSASNFFYGINVFTNRNNTLVGSFSGDGTGLTNVSAGKLNGFSSGSFWNVAGNLGTSPGSSFLGTTDNQALEIRVNSARALRLEPTTETPNLVGGFSGNSMSAGVVGSTISGGGTINFGLNTNIIEANYATIGGGAGNHIEANARFATISGGFHSVIQRGSVDASIGNGGSNQIQTNSTHSRICGGELNVIQSGADHATIGGGYQNTVTVNGRYAAVGGGWQNTSGGITATVGGGIYNNTFADYSFIGGGDSSFISPEGVFATVGGGFQNTNTGYAATVTGGYLNRALSGFATVGGGVNNQAELGGTVPGGQANRATGANSFAAGTRALANHDGSFVCADFTDADFASTAPNQFLIRASGGVGIGTATPQAALHAVGNSYGIVGVGNNTALSAQNPISRKAAYLATTAFSGYFVGDVGVEGNLSVQGNVSVQGNLSVQGNEIHGTMIHGTGPPPGFVGFSGLFENADVYVKNAGVTASFFDSLSDRNLKAGFAQIDKGEILSRVAGLPISSWHFKEHPEARHIGPTAQDFHAAFSLNGPEDKHINMTDAAGVALAAIQGLNQKVEDENRALRCELTLTAAQLKSQQDEINELVARLRDVEKKLTQVPLEVELIAGPADDR